MSREQELSEKYKLDGHQIPYLLKAHELVNFQGKTVLEVGGCIPPELALTDLGAKQWIANEYLDYWSEIGAPLPTQDIYSITGSIYQKNIPYAILTGAIEELPESYFNKFDAILSIAAFEHIAKFPEALERMYKALKRGGKLISIFAPIWSSHDGHHLPSIFDENGDEFSFSNNPLPPWGHLYMSRTEIYDYLRMNHSREFSRKVMYYIFNSNHLNRYFFNDFQKFIEDSNFLHKSITPIFPREVPTDVLNKLTQKHGDQNFTHNGMLIILEK